MSEPVKDAGWLPIREDGWLIDPDTGEVVGAYGWMDKPEVEDEQDLWLVQKQLLKIDSMIIGEKAQMRHIVEMCEKRIKSLERRKEWIEHKYGPSAFALAKTLLPKGRKTYTSPYGEIAYRSTKDRLVIDDQTQAVQWAKLAAPESVKKVEAVMVSRIPAEVMHKILSLEVFVPHGMHIEPGAETAKFVRVKGEEDGESDQA